MWCPSDCFVLPSSDSVGPSLWGCALLSRERRSTPAPLSSASSVGGSKLWHDKLLANRSRSASNLCAGRSWDILSLWVALSRGLLVNRGGEPALCLLLDV